MPWTDAINQEYSAMLSGTIEQALDLQNDSIFTPEYAKLLIKVYAQKLEMGEYEDLKIEPVNQNYLTGFEMRLLHAMRVACSLYAERNGIFPWKLGDKTVSELRPLISINYMGLTKKASHYYFHRVWNVKPGERLMESITGYALLVILVAFGVLDHVPTNEYDMICFLIQNLRDSGWSHMMGHYDAYEDYPNHGYGVYDYEIYSEVKRTGCHSISDYLASLLKSFNIASHIGIDPVHLHGHCYIHFSSIDKWLSHGDDVYNAKFSGIPVEFSFKSDSWMNTYAFGSTGYGWTTACVYESAFWWCFLLGKHNAHCCDVRYLYHHDQLRNTLETLHDGIDWTQYDHPDPIPPIFNETMVNFLMDWVEKKIQNETEE